MNKFMLLYKGPLTSPNASHDGWPEWFAGLGDALISKGGPMRPGLSVQKDNTQDNTVVINGYSIIQADDLQTAVRLAQSHPYAALGQQYSIEIFAL